MGSSQSRGFFKKMVFDMGSSRGVWITENLKRVLMATSTPAVISIAVNLVQIFVKGND